MSSDGVGHAAPERSDRRATLAGIVLLALLATVFLASPRRIFLDSRFALISSEALLERGSFDLAPYMPWQVEKVAAAEGGRPRLPYQLLSSNGKLLYIYPVGTSLLSLPLVPVLRLFGESAVNAEGFYTPSGERSAQAILAALISALTGWLIYRAALHELTPVRAALLALVTALGTSLWSAASRTLWTHCWETCLAAAVWLELLRWEETRKPRPVLLGALLSMIFWVRPTGVALILPVTLFVLLRHRRQTYRLIGTGALGALVFVGLSYLMWGAPLPPYYSVGASSFGDKQPILQGIAGMLLSPGRGLLFYSPIYLAVGWMLVRHGVDRPRRPLAWLVGSVFAAYVLLYASWHNWWGVGLSGPRFLCDVTPLLAWLGAVAWRRMRAADGLRPPRRRTVVLRAASVSLLIAAAVAAHAPLALDTGFKIPSKHKSRKHREDARAGRAPVYWRLRTVPQGRLLEMWDIDVGWRLQPALAADDYAPEE